MPPTGVAVEFERRMKPDHVAGNVVGSERPREAR